ncbi:pentatricopeptide repeat-containing protein [Emericellopsis atlantica]|uniref:Pentatricopeptide repeat-containing protein n=1 Tax=Emericellopsis atlantica TaxID=2614577 RepID=A0A9P8CRB8_9HYPO|nr:pentatricopeptide repeat-containing protein [Emericellopsis atlantica]KAG9256167.1 pentatricopeptide repeat-containing protein [Emericellopsis atlantica]
MKVSGRVDGTVCSAVLSRNRSAAANAVASLTGERISSPSIDRRPFCTAHGASVSKRACQGSAKPGPNFFCSKTAQWLHSTFIPYDSVQTSSQPRKRKPYSTAAASQTTTPAPYNGAYLPVRDKAVLQSYVPSEDTGPVDQYFDYYRDPYRRGYAQPDGPKLRISESKHDVSYPGREDICSPSDGTATQLEHLCKAIRLQMRHPSRNTHAAIHKAYSQLPEPRMLNFTGQWRARLLKVMGTPRRRDMESMLRYFGLIADIKSAGLTLRRSQWNYALSFATKYTSKAGKREMDSALRMWREMERDAQIPGNEVTFNILFDVAAKAGNFLLAEMVYAEMDKRGLEFNRYHHVSLIFYFGLKLDSYGIRAAYRDMVESGEMIDTIALNAVISGLLRCGEEAAAEETYQRMKSGNTPAAAEMPPRDYMMDKVVTKVLMMFSKLGKHHPPLRKSLQTNVQLAPNLRTYRLFVEHYAIKVGDLRKVAQFLDEMKFLKIPIHPTVFLALFKGFFVHGGFEGSDWSEKRLQNVLSALYTASDDNARSFRIDQWLVIWALRAVKKCCSNVEAVETTYAELESRWAVPPERINFMQSFAESVVEGRDLQSQDAEVESSLHRGFHRQSPELSE